MRIRIGLFVALVASAACLSSGGNAAPSREAQPVAALAAPALPQSPPVMRVHFIDVGQGDATLLEFPCGAVLVDTGGENVTVA